MLENHQKILISKYFLYCFVLVFFNILNFRAINWQSIYCFQNKTENAFQIEDQDSKIQVFIWLMTQRPLAAETSHRKNVTKFVFPRTAIAEARSRSKTSNAYNSKVSNVALFARKTGCEKSPRFLGHVIRWKVDKRMSIRSRNLSRARSSALKSIGSRGSVMIFGHNF